ncbi:MAG: phage tail protein [Oscillospiraceae bacterium]|nr:phage tail protein [Oscillospiraceae bacterium]
MNHGIKVIRVAIRGGRTDETSVSIPFFIGAAPVQSADNPAAAGDVVLGTGFAQIVGRLGYSDDWEKYDLCEAMDTHFRLYRCQPAIFCNLLDPAKMVTTVAAADMPVVNGRVLLPLEAINDGTLVVKPDASSPALVRGTDYDAFYVAGGLAVEVLEDGAAVGDDTLNIAYKAVNPAGVTGTVVAAGMENIENCLTVTGIIPDLICAPGHSSDPNVAAAMAVKAENISNVFEAMSVVDISAAAGGALTPDAAVTKKDTGNVNSPYQIACWPMIGNRGKIYRMSTHLCGLMAQVDNGMHRKGENAGIPYESPSNKPYVCDAVVLGDGSEVNMSLTDTEKLNESGIVTALNFINGITAWGNYTASYPVNNEDITEYFIPISRTFKWIGKSLIMRFWPKLDRPLTPMIASGIINEANVWLNALSGSGALLGARAEILENENPVENLMKGIIRVHFYATPPSPFQLGEFILEYDAEYVAAAFAGA